MVAEQGADLEALSADDFVLTVDGREQFISVFQRGSDSALDIALLFDTSESVRSALSQAKSATREFLRTLRPADCVFLLPFADQVGDGMWGRPSDDGLDHMLSGLKAEGRTSLYDALTRSFAVLSARSAKARAGLVSANCADPVAPDATASTPLLTEVSEAAEPRLAVTVVVTDGNDETSGISLADTVLAAWDSRIPVFPVAVGAANPSAMMARASMFPGRARSLVPLSHRLEQRLNILAELTGGTLVARAEWSRLADAYQQMVASVRGSYLLGFSENVDHGFRDDQGRSSRWRAVRITSKREGVRVVHPPGYLSGQGDNVAWNRGATTDGVTGFSTEVDTATIAAAASSAPDDWEMQWLSARLLFERGEAAQSLPPLERAQQLRPWVGAIDQQLARVHYELGNSGQVWNAIIRALARGSDVGDLYRSLMQETTPPERLDWRLRAPRVFVTRSGDPRAFVAETVSRAFSEMLRRLAVSPNLILVEDATVATHTIVFAVAEEAREQATATDHPARATGPAVTDTRLYYTGRLVILDANRKEQETFDFEAEAPGSDPTRLTDRAVPAFETLDRWFAQVDRGRIAMPHRDL